MDSRMNGQKGSTGTRACASEVCKKDKQPNACELIEMSHVRIIGLGFSKTSSPLRACLCYIWNPSRGPVRGDSLVVNMSAGPLRPLAFGSRSVSAGGMLSSNYSRIFEWAQ